MPHQCLNCGETFEEGSQDLLEGCPQCEGTRFFYTEEPVDEAERQELKDEAGQNAHEMLQEIMEQRETPDKNDDIWSRDAWEDWIRLKTDDEEDVAAEELDPTDLLEQIGALKNEDGDEETAFETLDPEEQEQRLEESVQVRLDDVQEADAPEPELEEPDEATNGDKPLSPEAAQDAMEIATEGEANKRPSTLNISEPGQYEIDVQRLMEDSPVIVERDGSYVIHLPSVFDKRNKDD